MNQKELRLESIAKKLRPIDDVMFQKMAEDIDFCEEIITTIMGESVKVIDTIPQDSIKNLQGRSVILDALCLGADNRRFNLEIQRANDDDHQRRVRYNGACITANVTPTSTKFEDVPDVCVIYISEFDLFGLGKSVYHADRILRESGKLLDNGFTEIYVNATSTEKNDVAELMELFIKRDVYNDQKFPATSKRKRQFTEPEKGAKSMNKEWQEFVDEEKKEVAMTTAERCFRKKMSFSDVKDILQEGLLSDEELRQIEATVK